MRFLLFDGKGSNNRVVWGGVDEVCVFFVVRGEGFIALLGACCVVMCYVLQDGKGRRVTLLPTTNTIHPPAHACVLAERAESDSGEPQDRHQDNNNSNNSNSRSSRDKTRRRRQKYATSYPIRSIGVQHNTTPYHT